MSVGNPKKVDIEGVCVECGNPGLPGDTCSFCGGMIEKIDAGLEDPLVKTATGQDEPETYPLEVLDSQEKDDGKDLADPTE